MEIFNRGRFDNKFKKVKDEVLWSCEEVRKREDSKKDGKSDKDVGRQQINGRDSKVGWGRLSTDREAW